MIIVPPLCQLPDNDLVLASTCFCKITKSSLIPSISADNSRLSLLPWYVHVFAIVITNVLYTLFCKVVRPSKAIASCEGYQTRWPHRVHSLPSLLLSARYFYCFGPFPCYACYAATLATLPTLATLATLATLVTLSTLSTLAILAMLAPVFLFKMFYNF